MPKRLDSLNELAVPSAKRHKPNVPEEALPEVQHITILDEFLKNFVEDEAIPEILLDDLLNFAGVNSVSENEVSVPEILSDNLLSFDGVNSFSGNEVPELLSDVTSRKNPAVTNNTGYSLPKVSISMQMLARCGRNQTYLVTKFLTEGKIGKIRQVKATMHLLDCSKPQINDRFTISVEDPVASRIPNFHFLLSLHDNKKTALTKTITLPVIWRPDNTFEFSFYIHVENRELKTKSPRKSNILFRFNDTTVYTISPEARSHHIEKFRENEQTNPVVVDVFY